MSETKIFKTKISTSIGTFEFEGTEEFVGQQIDKIVEKATQTRAPLISEVNQSKSIERDRDNRKPKARKSSSEQPKMMANLINNADDIADLKGFYASKAPESNIENFAVFALWLKNRLSIEEVSIDEMWTIYKILSIKPPKVMIQVFRDGKSKKAYFEIGKSSGKYYITSFGESFVDYDLPVKKVK